MTRADWLAASPKCDRYCGPLAARAPCDMAMHWVQVADNTFDGVWCCPKHGAMLNGVDAALRAGYISYIYVEPGAAA